MRQPDTKREDAAYDRGRVDALREVAKGIARSGVAEQTARTIEGYADQIEAQARMIHGERWPESKWIEPATVRGAVVEDTTPGDYS